MENADLIISGGTCLTAEQDQELIETPIMVIQGDTIVEIGDDPEIQNKYQAAKQIDASGCLIIPGLINAHTHAPMTVLRGIADMVGKWSIIYPVMKYVNKAGSHNTKTVVFGSQYGSVIVWDLGHKLLFTCFTTLPNGVAVAPRSYTMIHKQQDMFYDIATNMVELMMASLKAAQHTINKVDPVIWQDWTEGGYMRTLESDTIAHDRWGKLGGWV